MKKAIFVVIKMAKLAASVLFFGNFPGSPGITAL